MFVRLLDLEISRHDWQGMQCGCDRSAAHVPEDLLSALRGRLPDRVGEGWADNHVYIQSNLMPPALATASVIAAALADRGVPLEWRPHLLAVLNHLVCGEQDDVADRCKDVVRGCVELLFEEITADRSRMAAAYAFELLMEFPELKERLRFYQTEMRANLPDDLHPERLDLDEYQP
ncbi:hypothetical protein [Streptomyces sp. SAI-129]|uniref:hypothetical protein n=1 Tax=Streptomyces sp. SAI-129 TaxID=3377727 RepID=UPI003C7B8A5B